MAASLINRINIAVQRFEHLIAQIITGRFPPGAALAIDTSSYQNVPTFKPNYSNIKDIIDNGFLWAVPKARRSVEKRRNRKYGFPQWTWKPLVPRTDILVCNTCGHDHLSDTLCPQCYGRAKAETLKMQEDIEKELKLDPVEKEVVVLYEGESGRFWKNQRIVELPRKRPAWFTSNLLQQTTEVEAEKEEPKLLEPKPNELA